MNEPVDRFCEMIAAFEPKDRQEILTLACMAVGCPDKPTGVTPTKGTLLSELSHPYVIDDIRNRLNLLLAHTEVWPLVLLNGIVSMLTYHYERLADPQDVSARIDRGLADRRELEAELAKPVEERPVGLTDEKIHRKMHIIELIMTTAAAGRQRGERLAAQILAEYEKRFTQTYWYEWQIKYLESLKPEGLEPSI